MDNQLSNDEVKAFVAKMQAWSEILGGKEREFLGEIIACAISPHEAESVVALDYPPSTLRPLLSYARLLTQEYPLTVPFRRETFTTLRTHSA